MGKFWDVARDQGREDWTRKGADFPSRGGKWEGPVPLRHACTYLERSSNYHNFSPDSHVRHVDSNSLDSVRAKNSQGRSYQVNLIIQDYHLQDWPPLGCAQRLQSCPTLCDPVDCSPQGSVHRILQAEILEWVAFLFSRGSSQPRDRTCISCTAGGVFTAEPSVSFLNLI